ncbi:MAG: hypothetical protein K2Q22_00815 [Cytophagales bacterium]|nr:hypothetical protein [Cytophagales bacterium]
METATLTNYAKTHLSHLISLAFVDGKLTNTERKQIYSVGLHKGLRFEEIDQLFFNPEFRYDKEMPKEEKFNQMYDLIQMSKSNDGIVDQQELELCNTIAVKLGIKAEKSPLLIKTIIQCIENDVPKQVAGKKAEVYL